MLPTLWRTGSIWSPFEGLTDLRREMDALFDRFFGRHPIGTDRDIVWAPPVSVREDDTALYVECEIPGVSREDVKVTVENGVLTISGEKGEERREGQEGTYHVFERRYGRFERRFTLPSNVDAEHIRARYVNGVLEVTLPKTEAAKPRQIEIQAEATTR